MVTKYSSKSQPSLKQNLRYFFDNLKHLLMSSCSFQVVLFQGASVSPVGPYDQRTKNIHVPIQQYASNYFWQLLFKTNILPAYVRTPFPLTFVNLNTILQCVHFQCLQWVTLSRCKALKFDSQDFHKASYLSPNLFKFQFFSNSKQKLNTSFKQVSTSFIQREQAYAVLLQ